MQIKESIRELIASGDMTEKQTDIICAAIELFSQKGYEATTTREIAEKANVAEGSIFRYYKTKKDLLLAIPECLRKIISSRFFLEGINEILENNYENFEDLLRSIILDRKKFVFENMPIIKIIVQEIPFHPELRDNFLNALMSSMGKYFKVVDKFKEQGQLIDIPSPIIINLIFSSIFGYFFTRYIISISQVSLNEKEEIDYLVQYILNGVRKR